MKEGGQGHGSGALKPWREGGRRDQIEGEEHHVVENESEESGGGEEVGGFGHNDGLVENGMEEGSKQGQLWLEVGI